MKPSASDPLQRLLRAAARAPAAAPSPLPRPAVRDLLRALPPQEPAAWDPLVLRRVLRPTLAAACVLLAVTVVLSLAGLHTVRRDVFTTSQIALTTLATP